MTRTRLFNAVAATGAALLMLTACSSSSDANEDNADVDKGVVIEQILGELQGSVSGLPDALQAPILECWSDGLQGFSTDELVTLRDAGAIPAVVDGWEPIGDVISDGLNEKAEQWYNTCVPTASDAEMVPATP
jgi:hypothetical protein